MKFLIIRERLLSILRVYSSKIISWFESAFKKIKNLFSDALNIFISPDIHTMPLGLVLVKEKVITESQLKESLELQKYKLKRLGRIIVDRGYATEKEILDAVANHYRISAGSLTEDLAELIKNRPITLKEKLFNLRIPIRVRLSITITFIIWLTILILSFVILARQKDNLYEQTVRTGKVSLNYFTRNASNRLLNNDILGLNSLIKEAASVEGILYAVIIDREKVIKAHSDPAKIGTTLQTFDNAKELTVEEDISYFDYTLPPGSHVLNLSRPVMFKNVELGEVHVGVSLDFINKQIYKESKSIIILSLFIVILGIAISILIGIGFSRPISKLVLATKEIGKGNFLYKIEMLRRDEFGDLASAFNYMSQELWKKLMLQKSFGRYVSPEVLDMIMAHPEESWLKGTRNEATILFTDIRDFTAYSEKKEPEEVIEALNEYFGIATQFILEYGGYIDKFIGDAVLSVFGVPVQHPDHVERAVKSAVAMQKKLKESGNNGNQLLSAVGIGINSGVVVSGTLGSQVKMEYTVIGDSVNVAARINHFAGAGEIIISKECYQSIKNIVSVEPLKPQKIKGKAEFIEAFKVLDIKGASNDQ
jgi:adenylate cyclase